jgi:large subunit ribosomal protein L17
MRHRNKGKILDREIGPRRALLRALATSIVLHEKIQTTEAKAKAVRPLVERLITKAKAQTLASRREVARVLYTETAVKKIVEDLGKRYKDRNGGYTRTVKLGIRVGDSAHMVQIELV